jgi:CubicO group peptidase (beta-lactamase class C family)
VPISRKTTFLLLPLVLVLLLAWVLDAPGQLRYWKNYLSYGFAEPDRQLQTGKYAPVAQIASGSGEVPPEATLPDHQRRAADAYFARSDSYAVLAARDGELLYARYAEGLGHDTLFDAWSMSKTMVAFAMGYALDSGLIDGLDTPIGQWIGEWAQDERGSITIRQLLNNESGLEKQPFSFEPYNEALGFFVGVALEDTVLGTPLARPPGSAFEFNHVNSQALVLLLERMTGKRYASILSEYLWEPLAGGAAAVPLDHRDGLARGVCCFLSSPLNWLKLGMLLADEGRYRGRQVISRAWIEEMTRPAPRNPNFGFALWLGPFDGSRLVSEVSGRTDVIKGRFLADDALYAEGSGGVRLYVAPSEKLVVVRFGEFQGFPVREDWNEAELMNVFLSPGPASPGEEGGTAAAPSRAGDRPLQTTGQRSGTGALLTSSS